MPQYMVYLVSVMHESSVAVYDRPNGVHVEMLGVERLSETGVVSTKFLVIRNAYVSTHVVPQCLYLLHLASGNGRWK